MSDFNYRAIDKQGKAKKGTIDAKDEETVKSKLKADGLTVIEITKANAFNKDININIGGGVSSRDLSVFCRQFTSMINAGVTIMDTLDMLGEQTENKTMAKAIRGVHSEIQKGETLSDGLAKYPKVFPSIMRSMVAAGEASGKLEVAFDRMAEHFEKSEKMKAIVKKAAMYPIIVVIVAIAVVIVMLVKVIPSYQSMFDDLGADLPKITQAVVAMSNFIMNDWLYIIIGIAVMIGAFMLFKKTEIGQKTLGTISMKMPIFGKLNVKSAASNFARTLSTLVYSGLPMIEALGITANTMSNYWYKKALEHAKDEVAKGVPLSEPIVDSGLFPPMVGHMTKIGEETGDLEGMLTRLATYYDEEVEATTQTVMAALEPMIILVLAAIVGVLVAAIMAPMIAMYGAMDSM